MPAPGEVAPRPHPQGLASDDDATAGSGWPRFWSAGADRRDRRGDPRRSTTVAPDVVAYFDNSNGIFAGDEVRILGVPVGKIDKIEPQPQHVKITFWFDNKYKVPADAKAVILSPSLVTSRAIQLTPAYTGGPACWPTTR